MRKTINSPLKISHFRLIDAISEFGQMTTAAESLLMTQPAASRLLSEMEAQLGVQLCERHAKGLELTQYGKRLAERAKNILIEMRNIPQDMLDLSSGRGGIVRVGAVTGAAVGYVVPAIQQLKASSPHTIIDAKVGSSVDLVKELVAGDLDFILSRIPSDMDPNPFLIIQSQTENVEFLVRQGHPLASRKSVSLEDLIHYEWVMQARGNPIREVTERAFVAAVGASPNRVVNTTSLLLVISLLTHSSAISPVANEVSNLLINGPAKARLETLSVKQSIEVEPYNLITVKGRQLSPTAQHLRELILIDIEKKIGQEALDLQAEFA